MGGSEYSCIHKVVSSSFLSTTVRGPCCHYKIPSCCFKLLLSGFELCVVCKLSLTFVVAVHSFDWFHSLETERQVWLLVCSFLLTTSQLVEKKWCLYYNSLHFRWLLLNICMYTITLSLSPLFLSPSS